MLKNCIKTVSMLLLLCLLYIFLTNVFIPKWEGDDLWEPVTNIIDGFYAEEKNSLDVIYMGSSNAYYGINPLMVWDESVKKESPLTGYTIGSSEQRIWTTYYYLQEVLKYQKPQIVVLDVLQVFSEDKNDEDKNRKAYDYMKLSSEKLASVKEAMSEDEELISYLMPFYRYHTRFNELTARDFSYQFDDKSYFLKGYAYSDMTVDDLTKFDLYQIKHDDVEIGSAVTEYLDKMIALCEQNDITLIFIKTPKIDWGINEHEAVKEFANERDIMFMDYNTFMSAIDISEATDFRDGSHLNYIGSEKLSRHLATVLIEHLKTPAVHSKKTTTLWNNALSEWNTKKAMQN